MTKSIDLYIKECRILDAERRKIKIAYTEEDNKLKEGIEKRKIKIREFMDKNKLTTINTKSGTAYTSILKTVSIENEKVFYNFVKKQQAYDLFTKKIVKTVYETYIEDGIKIPGVRIDQFLKLNIRKSSNKGRK